MVRHHEHTCWRLYNVLTCYIMIICINMCIYGLTVMQHPCLAVVEVAFMVACLPARLHTYGACMQLMPGGIHATDAALSSKPQTD